MPVLSLEQVRGGLDATRLPDTTPAGSLIRAYDCHINRGGEVEQRAAFVLDYDPSDTIVKGLARGRDGLVLFGSALTAPADLPAGYTYQRLAHPAGETLSSIIDAQLFRGQVVVIGRFVDGSTHMFADGVRVDSAFAPPNLTGSDAPAALLTQKSVLFAAAGPNLFSSKIKDATSWDPVNDAGARIIDMSAEADGSESLIALARYESRVAVFASDAIQMWFVDPDPLQDQQVQVLSNTGAVSARSVLQFRDGDVAYLSPSGVRSLRARDSSTSAATFDLGTRVDPLVIAAIEAATDDTLRRACCVVEPRDGRLWVAIGEEIFIFTYFPEAKVSSWSIYRPGFAVAEMVKFNKVLYLRSVDGAIYTYGGGGATPVYSDDVIAEAWTAYLTADAPTVHKDLFGYDVACRGTWQVDVDFTFPVDGVFADPINLGRVTNTSFNGGKMSATGSGTHVSLRFTSTAAASTTEPAVLSAAALHYEANGDPA